MAVFEGLKGVFPLFLGCWQIRFLIKTAMVFMLRFHQFVLCLCCFVGELATAIALAVSRFCKPMGDGSAVASLTPRLSSYSLENRCKLLLNNDLPPPPPPPRKIPEVVYRIYLLAAFPQFFPDRANRSDKPAVLLGTRHFYCTDRCGSRTVHKPRLHRDPFFLGL